MYQPIATLGGGRRLVRLIPAGERWLTVTEAAALLGLSRRMVERYLALGRACARAVAPTTGRWSDSKTCVNWPWRDGAGKGGQSHDQTRT